MNVPTRLRSVNEKLESGVFRSALSELETIYDAGDPRDRALLAELMLRRGKLEQGAALAHSVAQDRIPIEIRARGLEHLGYAARHTLKLHSAINLWQRSVRTACRARDDEQVCRSQLHLMSAQADAHGPDALGHLPRDVRTNVRQLAIPRLTLSLHWRFAEIEARRSRFVSAERHLASARALLAKHPNAWLEARIDLLQGVVSEATSQLANAVAYSTRALEGSRLAGCSFIETAALSNLGHLYAATGQFDLARSSLAKAMSSAASWPSLRRAVVATAARLELLQGNLRSCESLIGRGGTPRIGGPYSNLDNTLTKVLLLRGRKETRTALHTARSALALAERRGAPLLLSKFQLVCADLLIDLERHDDARAMLNNIDIAGSGSSLSTIAELERIQGRLAFEIGALSSAQTRLERARRVFAFVGDEPGQQSAWRQLVKVEQAKKYSSAEDSKVEGDVTRLSADLLRVTLAARMMFEFSRHPILLGMEVLSFLIETKAVKRAGLIMIEGNVRRVIHHFCWPNLDNALETEHVAKLGLGREDETVYELIAVPEADFSASELLRLLFGLVESGVELHSRRMERLRVVSSWSVEAKPDDKMGATGSTMRSVLAHATRLAKANLPAILITGETGVGKEFVARAIHEASQREKGRFEAINCAAIPHHVFEAHLFGHRRGAFTDATSNALGVIRACEGGTTFLDEIGEIHQDLQVKLLRFLDAREVHPLGEARAIPVDVSIIAATNADLPRLVLQKGFREDLYYRLAVAPLVVPPLRERRDEIPALAREFVGSSCARSRKPPLEFSEEALDYMTLYDWPGNVRELKNEIERLVAVTTTERIAQQDLKREIVTQRSGGLGMQECQANEITVSAEHGLEHAVASLESQMIVRALGRCEGSYTLAAQQLGLSRKGLWNKRLRLGLF